MQITSLQRAQTIAQLVQFMSTFGYELVEMPIIEPAELFLTKAGYQLIDRLLAFERMGHDLTLRPEFTAGALYQYIHANPDRQPIIRWQFNGPVFQETSSNMPHPYQSHSVGAELIGMDGPSTEAEVIAMAALGLRQTAITQSHIVVGHVGLMRHLLEQFGLDSRTLRFVLSVRPMLKGGDHTKTDIEAQLDRYLSIQSRTLQAEEMPEDTGFSTERLLDTLLSNTERAATMGGRTREDIARRLQQKRKRVAERTQILTAIDFLQQWCLISAEPASAFAHMRALIAPNDTVALQYLNHWNEVLELLEMYDIAQEHIIVQPDLARTWDYYTGIVFELRAEDGNQLGGGGRYDELAKLIGGTRAIPAVGFAYYLDELLLLEEHHSNPLSPLGLEIAPDTRSVGAKWAQRLRQHGFQITLLPSVDRGTSAIPRTLIAMPDGTIAMDDTRFSIDELDKLITELNAQ